MAGKPMARALFDIKSTQVPSKRFDGPTADETLDVEDDVVKVTYPSFHGLANWCDEHERYYDGRDFCPECVENEIEPDPYAEIRKEIEEENEREAMRERMRNERVCRVECEDS